MRGIRHHLMALQCFLRFFTLKKAKSEGDANTPPPKTNTQVENSTRNYTLKFAERASLMFTSIFLHSHLQRISILVALARRRARGGGWRKAAHRVTGCMGRPSTSNCTLLSNCLKKQRICTVFGEKVAKWFLKTLEILFHAQLFIIFCMSKFVTQHSFLLISEVGM